jgi:hypothetical protein
MSVCETVVAILQYKGGSENGTEKLFVQSKRD